MNKRRIKLSTLRKWLFMQPEHDKSRLYLTAIDYNLSGYVFSIAFQHGYYSSSRMGKWTALEGCILDRLSLAFVVIDDVSVGEKSPESVYLT